MGSKGVQFRGIEPLIRCFDNCKIYSWAVLYDKNINCKYIGTNETESRETLSAFLKLVSLSNSTSVYTLNLYEDLPKLGKIKPSTEPDYSFNFTLFDDDMQGNTFHGRRNLELEAMRERVMALEAKLLAEQEAGDDDEEEGGINGVINGILGSEKFKTWIQDKAFMFADKLFDKPANVIPMQNTPARVGAVPPADAPYLIDEVQTARAAEAVEILARIDAKLGDNLLKIARLAQTDPAKYSMFAAML